MKHGKLLTQRRQVVLDVIQASRDPLSPAEIYTRVTRQVGHIALATVYRTLKQLGDEGILRRVVLPTGEFHYESHQEETHRGYSLCRKCGSLSFLKLSQKDSAQKKVLPKGFQVEFQERLWIGLCRECRRPG